MGEGDEAERLVRQAIGGDGLAYGRLARLVTGHLVRWRAYDFRADWEDVAQDVLLSVMRAHAEGRLAEDGATLAFLRQATRNKFIDRLRRRTHRATEASDRVDDTAGADASPWPPRTPLRGDVAVRRTALSAALDRMPDRERVAVLEVHLLGHTYDEASARTGIPVGTLKRAVREGLARLRSSLESPE